MDKNKSKKLAFTIIFAAFVLIVAALSIYFKSFLNGTAYEGPVMDISKVNWLDRVCAFPFNKGIHDTATAAVFLNLAGVVLAYIIYTCVKTPEGKFKAFMIPFVLCFEAFILTKGAYDILKTSVCRIRPFMYFENPYLKSVLNGDWQYSWPSGHTANAFLAPAFITACILLRKDKSTAGKIFIAVSYVLAALIGASRVISGNHFVTDVLSGALLGTMCGFIVPALNSWFGLLALKPEGIPQATSETVQ